MADGVDVGRVGVRVGVFARVGDGVCVAVGDSEVIVSVRDGVRDRERVCAAVAVSSGGGPVRGIRKNANRIITIRAGIPNRRSQGGSEDIVF